MDGILVIRKEKGYTSHDVVAIIRRLLHTKKVGHAGTLDPDAEGVLPVCVGRATRAADMLPGEGKAYTASVRLGVITDTQDTTGTILETRTVDISEPQIRTAAAAFEGKISQIPPLYSAIKVGGKKLYEYARAGEKVERPVRTVRIDSIAVRDVTKTGFSMHVCCSKGTYIRTLCHDIGMKLGCGAAMESLVRTKSGGFSIEQAVTLSELEHAVSEGRLHQILHPVDQVFSCYPAMRLNEELTTRIRNGAVSAVPDPLGRYRVYGADGGFLCVGEVVRQGSRRVVRTVKNFF